MNSFDKQRIENAIWILEQYSYEIKQIAREIGFDSWESNKIFDVLEEIKEQLRSK